MEYLGHKPILFFQYVRGMHILAMTLKVNYILFQRGIKSQFFLKKKKTVTSLPFLLHIFLYHWHSFLTLHRVSQLVIHNSNFSDSLLVHYLQLSSLHSEVAYKLPYSVGMLTLLLNLLRQVIQHSLLCEALSSGFCASSPCLHPTTLVTPLLSSLETSSSTCP